MLFTRCGSTRRETRAHALKVHLAYSIVRLYEKLSHLANRSECWLGARQTVSRKNGSMFQNNSINLTTVRTFSIIARFGNTVWCLELRFKCVLALFRLLVSACMSLLALEYRGGSRTPLVRFYPLPEGLLNVSNPCFTSYIELYSFKTISRYQS